MSGTKMFCPYCKEITSCSAAPFVKAKSNDQQLQSTKYEDIHWFERGRLCADCFKGFTTVEINKKFLHELIELRDLRTALKGITESCIEESNQLTSFLKNLHELFETK